MQEFRLLDLRRFQTGVCALLMMCVSAGCATISCSPLATHIAHDPRLCANVSVIFVDATPDLGQWGEIPELTQYFGRSGVETFYFHPFDHGDEQCLASWIYHEKVHRGRQVMVVGWSYGLVNALDALKILEKQSVGVDTLVSIDCFCLNYHRGRHLQPANAQRVVLIYRKCAKLPVGFHCPAVCRVDEWNHVAVPGHPSTVNTLFRETLRLGQIQVSAKSRSPLIQASVVCPACGKPENEGAAVVQQISLAPSSR